MELRDRCPACYTTGGRLRRVAFSPFVAERCGVTATEVTVCMCPECGTVYSRDVPTDEQLFRLYDGYRGEAYNTRRLKWEPLYDPGAHLRLSTALERRLRVSEWVPSDATILDYGGGDGSLMPTSAPWRGVVDPSGVKVASGVESLAALEDAPMVNTVLCLHVLEHVAGPLGVLRDVSRKLKRIGQVVIEVPMAGPVLAGKWPYRVHEHLQWFSPRGLERMAQLAWLIVGRSETAETCLGLVRTVSLHRA